MTLTQRVEELTISCANESKRNIGAFILRKKSRLREYNTQRIAAETYASKAALVRFAKSLGFSGWTEFSREYVREQRYQETRYSEIDPNVPFRDDSSTQDIIQQMCSLEMESLMDTADLLAPQTVDRIVDLMKRSGRIALFGMSPNNLLGELFRRRMLTVGRMIEVPALGDSGLLASTLRDTDCAIMISYSGNAPDREPLTAFRFLEPNRVPVVRITSYGPIAIQKILIVVLLKSRCQ